MRELTVGVQAQRGGGGDEDGDEARGQRHRPGPSADAAVAFQQEHHERGGDEQGGGDERELPFSGGGPAGEFVAAFATRELDQLGRRHAGALQAEGEIPARGVGAGVEQEGAGPVAGGLGPAVLLGEGETEVVAGGPVGGSGGEGGPPVFLGGGIVAALVGLAARIGPGRDWCQEQGEREEEREQVAPGEERERRPARNFHRLQGAFGAGHPVGRQLVVGAVQGAVGLGPELGPGGGGVGRMPADTGVDQGRAGRGVGELPEFGSFGLPNSELSAERGMLSASITEGGERDGETGAGLAAEALRVALAGAEGGEDQPEEQRTEDGGQKADPNKGTGGQGNEAAGGLGDRVARQVFRGNGGDGGRQGGRRRGVRRRWEGELHGRTGAGRGQHRG